MSVEANKALVCRYLEQILNRGNLAAADELLAPGYINHALPPGMPPGRESAKWVHAMIRAAFPDFHYTIEDLIAVGDRVVVRGTGRGTHRGALFSIPPTGRPVAITGIHIFRLAEGAIVEHWGNQDDLGMLQQLGVIPGPIGSSR